VVVEGRQPAQHLLCPDAASLFALSRHTRGGSDCVLEVQRGRQTSRHNETFTVVGYAATPHQR
jgi:hypothetical protein